MKNCYESRGVGMKIRMKYGELHNESRRGRYENQNEILRAVQ